MIAFIEMTRLDPATTLEFLRLPADARALGSPSPGAEVVTVVGFDAARALDDDEARRQDHDLRWQGVPADDCMRALELRIPPVVVVLVFAAAMTALAYAVPATVRIPAKAAVVLALVLSGALIAWAGVAAFRRHKTTANPFTPERASALVATGIYRFSRNPMYLGLLLALAGWSVYLANWASALLLPAFVAYMNRSQIRPEERALAERFGPQFLNYSRSVRRWL